VTGGREHRGVEEARAKLATTLAVGSRRPDGKHLIDAEMVTLDLADHLTFVEGDGLEVVGDESLVARVPPGPENLVSRALSLVRRRALVRIEKRIPVAAGLGGGSADAAAVLRWAGVSDPAVAARLGSDVAFCLRGGRGRVRGAGEVVESLSPVERTFVLLTPPVGVSTAAVYAAWDALGGPHDEGPNDLEPATLAVAPELGAWRGQIEEVTGRRPVLAGSGSTWFLEATLGSLGLSPGDVVTVGDDVAVFVEARTTGEVGRAGDASGSRSSGGGA
jgi:4-diphosphocytidyl-2-C-methyl-D-erythritol kinase